MDVGDADLAFNHWPCRDREISVPQRCNGVAVRGEPALPWEDAMFQVDPWEKAADCERALRLTLDPLYRENLTNIREFWISLANKRPFLSEKEFAVEAEVIGRLHANLTATTSVH